MLIALLVVLGVDLIVIVVIALAVLGCQRWLSRHPGAFSGAARVSSGEVHGLSKKWKHGSGRWVRDVLVWSKAPDMFRSELIPADGLSVRRPVLPERIRRLGDDPVVVIGIVCASAEIDVAAKADCRGLVIGPFSVTSTPPLTNPDGSGS